MRHGLFAMGPFYCPPDRTIYLDLTFFDDLARLGGPGDFAAAAAIGDDRLQRRSGGEVVPETFTHGTAADRQR